jgi:chromosome segregation ATPase
MLKRKSNSAEDLKREIKKLKRKNQDAKEIEIQLKQIINSKGNEVARRERWLAEVRDANWQLTSKLLEQEPQVNDLLEQISSLTNELADCQNKWDRTEKKLAKKREKLEIEREVHLDAVDATARWYKKFLENEKNERLLVEKERDKLKVEVANLKAELAESQKEKLEAKVQISLK